MKNKHTSFSRVVAIRNILTYHVGGMTAYELAKMFDVTPQTIHNNLLRHGRKIGITYDEVLHRRASGNNKAIYKKVWRIQEDAMSWIS